MKKLSKNRIAPRKLALHSEVVSILRPLALRELRDGRVVGGSGGGCSESTVSDPPACHKNA
jgi:hypothetical protein